MSLPDVAEPAHDWRDLDFWLGEVSRKPPPELAAGLHLWRRAAVFRWIEAAGGSLCCTDGRVLLPELAPCPAERALRYACRELEEQEHGTW